MHETLATEGKNAENLWVSAIDKISKAQVKSLMTGYGAMISWTNQK